MILVDSSVWIEQLFRTQSRAYLEFRGLTITDPSSIATCEPVTIELLAGPTDPLTVRRIEDQLDTLDDLTWTRGRTSGRPRRSPARTSGRPHRSFPDRLFGRRRHSA